MSSTDQTLPELTDIAAGMFDLPAGLPQPAGHVPMLTALRIVVERAAADHDQQKRRIADLLEANNAYLERARAAEAQLAALTLPPVGRVGPEVRGGGSEHDIPDGPGATDEFIRMLRRHRAERSGPSIYASDRVFALLDTIDRLVGLLPTGTE